jgi:hypothetical protein
MSLTDSKLHDHEQDAARAEEKRDDDPNADKNDAPAVPFEPDSDDKTPLGDTDEHSDA